MEPAATQRPSPIAAVLKVKPLPRAGSGPPKVFGPARWRLKSPATYAYTLPKLLFWLFQPLPVGHRPPSRQDSSAPSPTHSSTIRFARLPDPPEQTSPLGVSRVLSTTAPIGPTRVLGQSSTVFLVKTVPLCPRWALFWPRRRRSGKVGVLAGNTTVNFKALGPLSC